MGKGGKRCVEGGRRWKKVCRGVGEGGERGWEKVWERVWERGV